MAIVNPIRTVPGFENRVSDQHQRANMQTWASTECQKLPAPVHHQQTAAARQPQMNPARRQTASVRRQEASAS